MILQNIIEQTQVLREEAYQTSFMLEPHETNPDLGTFILLDKKHSEQPRTTLEIYTADAITAIPLDAREADDWLETRKASFQEIYSHLADNLREQEISTTLFRADINYHNNMWAAPKNSPERIQQKERLGILYDIIAERAAGFRMLIRASAQGLDELHAGSFEHERKLKEIYRRVGQESYNQLEDHLESLDTISNFMYESGLNQHQTSIRPILEYMSKQVTGKRTRAK